MSALSRLDWYYQNFGLRGVASIIEHHLFGKPKEMLVYTSGVEHPVHLRLRSSDPYAYLEVLRGGEYNFDLPFSPKAIVDAGANIGMASIFFAHKYPQAKIIAVEAEATNFSLLKRNIEPYSQIFPIHAALWCCDGEINVSGNEKGSDEWGFVTHYGGGVPVRSLTMRTLMAEMHLDFIDLLKVDIEGAEKEVFEDCDWIEDIGCLMIETHDRFKTGCSTAVNAACSQFSAEQRDFTTFYLRNRNQA